MVLQNIIFPKEGICDKAANKYRKRYKELTNLDFWKHYLDLED